MSKFVKLNYNEAKAQKIDDFNTKFLIQPLERGMANTLGTALRRVLLSSVYGIVPFAIRINGITHQYSPIVNVNLDVISLIARLSKLSFKIENNNNLNESLNNKKIYKVYFKSQNEGDFKVSDLVLDPEISIINDPNEVLGYLSTKNALEFELYLRYDRGYVDEEKNKLFTKENRQEFESKVKGELIVYDANFSPIKRVNVSVEELNSSSYNIQEKLEIDLHTNGTILAKEALSQAALILCSHLNIIGNLENLDLNNIFAEDNIKKEDSKFDSMQIDDLGLTVRSTNGLKRANYTKVSDLMSLTESDLRDITSLGDKSVREIVEKLKDLGIELEKGDK